MNALDAEGLGKRFGRRWALREATFELPAGARCALVGPNGAGKTTLLNLVTGLLAPTTGRVRVFGRPLEVSRVAFVAQDKPLYRRWSVADLLRFGAATNPRWDGPAAASFLSTHDIPLDQRADHLSGGQRTLVALALAVGKRADLLVLDEPLAELDPLARIEVMDAVRALDTTLLLSSHLLADLAEVCDQLILLGAGRVRLYGDRAGLLARHPATTMEDLVLDHLRNPGPPR
ncbi:ATP-binding cassette domain-containing protein [Nonomuraea gerenzanensis]|uniref:Putative ABC transporter ATP-binding protein n=1 Tax=Nonomuraea gerenzanensis TaxID=93944 RepID=A0A1M4EES0_9ACTN|nr:ABC transporter ATP-binding protein [Nonomuraea gerenzanensis]UBU08932.1 ABC transporter ATP-binding protein [Nonomuraea gerenzanensis]SBO97310.1 putative ABC transporter ATP-binding protein [Nonomuraea gerenzanensis]